MYNVHSLISFPVYETSCKKRKYIKLYMYMYMCLLSIHSGLGKGKGLCGMRNNCIALAPAAPGLILRVPDGKLIDLSEKSPKFINTWHLPFYMHILDLIHQPQNSVITFSYIFFTKIANHIKNSEWVFVERRYCRRNWRGLMNYADS